MVLSNLTPIVILAGMSLVLGVIHLAVGAGISGRYRDYGDVFKQTVSLSTYNLVIGILAIIISILALVATNVKRASLSRAAAISLAVLSILTIASLISAMVLSSQAISYIRDTLSYSMTTYIEDEESISITDRIQTEFECCGVNLWLDWARVPLGIGNGVGSTPILGRRRREITEGMSILRSSLRKRRQILPIPSNEFIYNFPSTYRLNLPLSCCKGGGITSPNAIGGYCVYNTHNGTSGFYVHGCLEEVANLAVSHISAFILINTILSILTIVLTPILFTLYREEVTEDQKESSQNQVNQAQLQPASLGYYNAGIYTTYASPNYSAVYATPSYPIYQQF